MFPTCGPRRAFSLHWKDRFVLLFTSVLKANTNYFPPLRHRRRLTVTDWGRSVSLPFHRIPPHSHCHAASYTGLIVLMQWGYSPLRSSCCYSNAASSSALLSPYSQRRFLGNLSWWLEISMPPPVTWTERERDLRRAVSLTWSIGLWRRSSLRMTRLKVHDISEIIL